MNIRTLLRRNPSTDPAHVPDPAEEREQEIRDLNVFDPDDINVRRLPNDHRDKAIWAVLAHYHHRIQNLTTAKDAAA